MRAIDFLPRAFRTDQSDARVANDARGDARVVRDARDTPFPELSFGGVIVAFSFPYFFSPRKETLTRRFLLPLPRARPRGREPADDVHDPHVARGSVDAIRGSLVPKL